MYRLVGKVYNPNTEEFEVRNSYCYFYDLQDTIIAVGYDFNDGHYVSIYNAETIKKGDKK